MRCAIYGRVSMDETDTTDKRYQSLDNQLEPLREWARSLGLEVVKEYTDRGSGADAARPNFKLLLQDAALMRFQVILVWKLDRFSRETMSVLVARVETLRKRGCAIKSLTESWLDTGTDNPMSELVLAVMSWAASEERRKISERTRAGIRRLRAIGAWHGGRPKRKGGMPIAEKETPAL